MTLATLYRYENDLGNGPYTSCTPHWKYVHHLNLEHPSPRQEGHKTLRNEFCALTTEQFPNWFTLEDCQELEQLGYCLKRYDVPAELIRFIGEKQVVFLKDEAAPPQPTDHRTLR